MRVFINRTLLHECPFKPETDVGWITASWVGAGVELWELTDFLDTFSEVAITHEALTEQIAEQIRDMGGLEVEVETSWETARMTVTVRADT